MRHEEKYICSEKQLVIIESRLKAVMPADINQKGSDYRIRSLYFDTIDDRMYHESLSGAERRSKYRLRFYNMSTDYFRMERKDSIGNLKEKYSADVSMDTALSLVNNEFIYYGSSGDGATDNGITGDGSYGNEGYGGKDNGLLRELHVLQQTEGLHPVTVVDYRRTAFTYPVGNVRITLDRDIACTFRTEEFPDKNALLYPVMPRDRHVLEVKYDSILPGFIKSILDMGSLERVSFSKYAYARSVIGGNGRKEDGYEF